MFVTAFMEDLFEKRLNPKIRIGTSGFSYADWRGVLYPENLSAPRMLDYYSKTFSTVEINSTYYRIPRSEIFEKMLDRTPPDFDFVVKTHSDFTHTRKMDPVVQPFKEVLTPILESGRLSAVLAQFPWSFQYREGHLNYIKEMKSALDYTHLVVEFRHQSWITENVFDFLRKNHIAFCCVDEPDLPGLVPRVAQVTDSIGYIRFHSRDGSKWWGSGMKGRYDYDYQESELKEWIPKIVKMAMKVEKIYIFFNNCHMGHAAKNAILMNSLLGIGKGISS